MTIKSGEPTKPVIYKIYARSALQFIENVTDELTSRTGYMREDVRRCVARHFWSALNNDSEELEKIRCNSLL